MNTSFTLKNVEVPFEGNTIKIGELSTTVEDYNLLEGLQFARAIPSIMHELKKALEEDDVSFESDDNSFDEASNMNSETPDSNETTIADSLEEVLKRVKKIDYIEKNHRF